MSFAIAFCHQSHGVILDPDRRCPTVKKITHSFPFQEIEGNLQWIHTKDLLVVVLRVNISEIPQEDALEIIKRLRWLNGRDSAIEKSISLFGGNELSLSCLFSPLLFFSFPFFYTFS